MTYTITSCVAMSILSEYNQKKTQRSKLEFVQWHISRIGCCISLKLYQYEFYLFLLELFKGHPEYNEKCLDMVDAIIHINKFCNIEVCVINANFEKTPISILRCINKAVRKKYEPKQGVCYIIEAM